VRIPEYPAGHSDNILPPLFSDYEA